MLRLSALFFASVLLAHAADLASPAGLWRTFDDKTGKARGLVRIYEENGAFFGKVEATLDSARAVRTCDACTDERKGQPILGMVILRNMKKDGTEFSGGDILDARTGSLYRCKFKLSDGGRKLVVRGFLGVSLFGRSQTWTREP